MKNKKAYLIKLTNVTKKEVTAFCINEKNFILINQKNFHNFPENEIIGLEALINDNDYPPPFKTDYKAQDKISMLFMKYVKMNAKTKDIIELIKEVEFLGYKVDMDNELNFFEI